MTMVDTNGLYRQGRSALGFQGIQASGDCGLPGVWRFACIGCAREADQLERIVLTVPAASAAGFIPVKVTRPVKRADDPPIRIEVCKSPTQIVVEGPMANAAACARWLRDVQG